MYATRPGSESIDFGHKRDECRLFIERQIRECRGLWVPVQRIELEELAQRAPGFSMGVESRLDLSGQRAELGYVQTFAQRIE